MLVRTIGQMIEHPRSDLAADVLRALGRLALFLMLLVARPAVAGEVGVTVAGDVPVGILGRWLVVTTLRPSPDRNIVVPTLVEFATAPDGSTAIDHRVSSLLPPEITATVEAGAGKQDGWTASDAFLAEVASRWDEIPREDPDSFLEVKYRLVTPEHYDEAFRKDERATKSSVVFSVARSPAPQPGGMVPMRMHQVLFIQDITPRALRGQELNIQVLGAPIPAPVILEGVFTAHRLDAPPPSPSLWEQLRARVVAFFWGDAS